MKNHKSIIFSLLAFLILSIFVVSCQQETLTDLPSEYLDESSTSNDVGKADAYILPKGFGDKTSDEIISYVNNLSDNEREKLAENYRIKTFLETENMYTLLHAQLEKGQLFTDINLNEQLTLEQSQRLNDFSLDETLSLRDCYTTPNYPMYKCHDPSWCGVRNYLTTNCYSNNWYCSSNTPGETVYQEYCGYPHDMLVRWHLYSCFGVCP